METEVLERGSIRILKLSGHINSSEVDALIAEFNKLKDVPGARCVMDMAVLKNLPTAVIGALIELIRHLETAGGRLVLAAPDATVRVPLDRLGIAPMVTITESTDEAVELLESSEAPEG
jgi:anti-anti-sigma factor